MQIKRFEARDMGEALRMIKDEFGPQAVILSARDMTRGKGMLGLLRNPGVEVTAAIDACPGAGCSKKEGPPAENWIFQEDPVSDRARTADFPAGRPARPLNLRQRAPMRRAVQRGVARTHVDRNDRLIRFLNLYEELVGQGVEEAVASALMEGLRRRSASAGRVGEEAVKSRLKETLEEMGVADAVGSGSPGGRRVLALVGPAGVGKTTTLIKIAITEIFQKGKKVGLIALNDQRIGAGAEIEAYAHILNVPAGSASRPEELEEILERLVDKDLILIDTPGMSLGNRQGMDDLRRLLNCVDPLEIHLVTAAGTRGKDFQEIWKRFGSIPVARLLFTKIDETVEYGSVLNALVHTRLPVSYFTTGQEIPEDIEEGSLERLIDMLWPTRTGRSEVGKECRVEVARDWNETLGQGYQTRGYVANKSSELFHRPSCKWAKKIDKKNMVVFRTSAEALANHFRPCRACRPGHGEAENGASFASERIQEAREIAAYRMVTAT